MHLLRHSLLCSLDKQELQQALASSTMSYSAPNRSSVSTITAEPAMTGLSTDLSVSSPWVEVTSRSSLKAVQSRPANHKVLDMPHEIDKGRGQLVSYPVMHECSVWYIERGVVHDREGTSIGGVEVIHAVCLER